MGLAITRRLDETFTIEYPNGGIRTIKCVDITGRIIEIDGALARTPIDLAGDVHISGSNEQKTNQCKFYIVAPSDVKIMRPNAKLKEKKQ